jgi:hypothetical protein
MHGEAGSARETAWTLADPDEVRTLERAWAHRHGRFAWLPRRLVGSDRPGNGRPVRTDRRAGDASRSAARRMNRKTARTGEMQRTYLSERAAELRSSLHGRSDSPDRLGWSDEYGHGCPALWVSPSVAASPLGGRLRPLISTRRAVRPAGESAGRRSARSSVRALEHVPNYKVCPRPMQAKHAAG